ncbi:MAG: mevalonate kinase family protein [Pseudonocardia sp.]
MRDTGAASATAPARICLAGESLDWMTGGTSVVAAIGLRTEVTATLNHHSRLVHLVAGAPLNTRRTVATHRLDQLTGDTLDYLQACAGGVMTDSAGGDLTSTTTVPVGAGVSSSAAVTVAASAALLTAAEGVVPDVQRLTELAYHAEATTGSGAGWMDFIACAYGGLRRIEATTPPATTLLAPTLGTPVLLIDTQQRRSTSRVLRTKRTRLAEGEPRMIAYRDQAPSVVEAITTALTAPRIDYEHLGTLISQAHELLRRYMGCSTPLIDRCVTACLKAGAYGAKLTGSGHGGCLFALVSPERMAAVVNAVAGLPVRPVVLTDTDSQGVQCTLLA